MDQYPLLRNHISLGGYTNTAALTYDPLLMGSVQPVPAPPSVKPPPPTVPPPANPSIYDPSKDIAKFTEQYTAAHQQQINESFNDDIIDIDIDNNDNNNNGEPVSVWDSNTNQYKIFEYNQLNPITGEYTINNNNEPPIKKRKLNNSKPKYINNNNNNDRFSLKSIGLQPLRAAAIIERLDNQPKLRYSEEFHRCINDVLLHETSLITSKLSHNNISLQNIYPTSNGISKQSLYTECGINPNTDQIFRNKIRANLLQKSIKKMIFIKQKDNLDETINNINDKHNHNHNDKQLMLINANKKSLEIAKKLGFVPNIMKKSLEDGEIKEYGNKITKSNTTDESAPSIVNNREIENAKKLLFGGVDPSPKSFSNNVSHPLFESKSILRNDGHEYTINRRIRGIGFNNSNSHIHYDNNISLNKYDSNFHPMFPITNIKYKFNRKQVSSYGLKLLRKYGYNCGDGLGKHKQGIKTFPRLYINANKSMKSFKSNDIHINKSSGFLYCIACSKSFCGYINLKTHILSKKHKKNLSFSPNNLVLLCVQCQIQFPTIKSIKQHFMLVKHDSTIPGISKFEKLLKDELRKNQIKYIQNFRINKPVISPLEQDIDINIFNCIKSFLLNLNILLPCVQPKSTWLYCPICKSFFINFSKFNIHQKTNKYLKNKNDLKNKDIKNKIDKLFKFIKEKQKDHLLIIKQKSMNTI